MGYLANIIQDARRQSVAGPFVPLPQEESLRPEIVHAEVGSKEVAASPSILSPASPQDDAVRNSLEAVDPVAPVREKAQRRGTGSAAIPSLEQAIQAGSKDVALKQEQERFLHTGGEDHKGPMAAPSIRTVPSAECILKDATGDAVPYPDMFERLSGLPPQQPRQVLRIDSTTVQSKSPSSASGGMEAAEHEDILPLAAVAAPKNVPLPVVSTMLRYEDPGRATLQTPILPLSKSATQARNLQNDALLLPPADREAHQSTAATIDERIWNTRDTIASGANQTKAVEPHVHIGRIEVVILGPESSRQSSPHASPAGGLVNRQYLRRL